MNVKNQVAAFALIGAACFVSDLMPARAADTSVVCSKPVGIVNTGQDGSRPRFIIQCTGGSSAGAITYFAYEISTSATLSTLLERVVRNWIIETKGKPITITSDLSDTFGEA